MQESILYVHNHIYRIYMNKCNYIMCICIICKTESSYYTKIHIMHKCIYKCILYISTYNYIYIYVYIYIYIQQTSLTDYLHKPTTPLYRLLYLGAKLSPI